MPSRQVNPKEPAKAEIMADAVIHTTHLPVVSMKHATQTSSGLIIPVEYSEII